MKIDLVKETHPLCDFKWSHLFDGERKSKVTSGEPKNELYVDYFAELGKDGMFGAFDLCVVTPYSPIQFDKRYEDLYGSIYERMTKYDDVIKNRESFLKEFVMFCMEFELISSDILKKVDEFMKQNPQYKFARIYAI